MGRPPLSTRSFPPILYPELGTDWNLRCSSKRQRQLWCTHPPPLSDLATCPSRWDQGETASPRHVWNPMLRFPANAAGPLITEIHLAELLKPAHSNIVLFVPHRTRCLNFFGSNDSHSFISAGRVRVGGHGSPYPKLHAFNLVGRVGSLHVFSACRYDTKW